jgi:hypothetical protein
LRNNLIKKFREISNHLSRDLNSKLQEEEKRREEKTPNIKASIQLKSSWKLISKLSCVCNIRMHM